MNWLLFILSFLTILIGCEFFTNAVEWAGKRFRLSRNAVGGVLAAIGTALPETVLPLIAILLVGGDAGQSIGTGAILGSPFTLATLALFVCGMGALLFVKRRKTKMIRVESRAVRFNLSFFIVAYSLAAIAALVPPTYGALKLIVGLCLVPLYIVYLYFSLGKVGQSQECERVDSMYFDRIMDWCTAGHWMPAHVKGDGYNVLEPSTLLIMAQIFISLLAIILGADLFVNQVGDLAVMLGVNALILSLLISPMATELPEMCNSLIWIREGKDVFALSNVLGSMVFQSCVIMSIGIWLTAWHIDVSNPVHFLGAISIGLALLAAIILFLRTSKDEVSPWTLALGGVFYLFFVALVLMGI